MDENTINEQEQTQEQNEIVETSLVDVLKSQLEDMTNKYLRVSADFDNYRKRTMKEKEEISKHSHEKVIKDFLVIVDDFELAIKHIQDTNDVQSIKEGVLLISNKFNEFLKSKGVNKIDDIGQGFNVELHDAVTKIPVEDENQKGKIVDVIKKGYTMNGKVIRYSKVVIGE